MINAYEFHALKPGRRVLFFGAIHGNEKCGALALQRLARELETGKLVLQAGSITMVPVCNPGAFAKHARQVEANLNRVFTKTKHPKSYESALANILCDLVDRSDVLLDLHSITANGEPFLYLDYPTARNRRLANVLGVKKAIRGWPELYERIGMGNDALDTVTYAVKQRKDAIIIECGQHDDPKSIDVAYRAIIGTLHHYGLLKGHAPKETKMQTAFVSEVYFRKVGQTMVKAWRHLEMVKKNTLLISGSNEVRAPFDGCLIMPTPGAKDGEDWLYFGRVK